MGLDIYAEWKGMTEEEKEAQYTGFQPKGSVGYLRQSWSSLTVWNNIFVHVFGNAWSDFLHPEWGGGNDGDGPDCSKKEDREFLSVNLGVLKEFMESGKIKNPKPIAHYFEEDVTPEDMLVIVKREVNDMVEFIEFVLEKGAKVKFS